MDKIAEETTCSSDDIDFSRIKSPLAERKWGLE